MINRYPHGSMQDMNLDWLLKVGKQADIDHNEWTHIKDTAQTMIDDAIQKILDDGEIGKIINDATTKVITEQIDPLKEQVGTHTTEITNLQKREGLFDHSGKTIIIGDSYTVGYTPDGNIQPWTTNFIKYTGLEDVTISADGGASFSTSNNSFLMLLNAVPASEDVKQILVVGGFNEFGSYSEIETAINAFMGVASVRFPNAKVFSAMVAWSVDRTDDPYVQNRLKTAKSVYNTQRKNWRYLTGSDYILHADGFLASDGFHPNTTGQERLATYLATAIETGSCSPSFYEVQANFEAGDFSPTLGSSWTFISSYNENTSTLIWGNYVCLPNSGTLVCDGTEYYLGRIFSTSFIGDHNGYTCYPTTVIIKSSSDFYHIPAQLNIRGRHIYLSLYDISNDKHNYRTLTEVTQVQIHRGSITM